MYLTTCVICGREFEGRNGAKYCSEPCKIEGRKRARRDWIDRTGFNEKKREAMRLYRQGITKEQEKQAKKKAAAHNRYLRRKAKLAKAAAEKELLERAASGDPWARMDVARNNQDRLEYWKAFRDYELQIAEDLDYASRNEVYVVNNIPVTDPDFAELVIESIDELGHIAYALTKL